MEFRPEEMYPDLAELSAIMSGKKKPQLIDATEITCTAKQNFIVQWEDIVQCFDTGTVIFMGMISEMDKESYCAKYLDKDIMKMLKHSVIYERKEKTVWEQIQNLHKSKGFPIPDDSFKKLRMEVEDAIYNDESGLIVDVSPPMSMLKGLMRLYGTGDISEIIFLVPNAYCNKCHEAVKTYLKRFFPKTTKTDVFVEFRNDSESPMYDFVARLSNGFQDQKYLKHTVYVTTDKALMEKISLDKSIKNVSFLFPERIHDDLSEDTATGLRIAKQECEYVSYKNLPIDLNIHNGNERNR